MPFEIFNASQNKAARRQGPAKLIVAHHSNGRSQITLSAAARDWLRPTPAQPDPGRRLGGHPILKVSLLIDVDARRLMLARCADDATDDHLYNVQGLGQGSSAYISGWNFQEELGLEAGHYPAELTGTDLERVDRALVISLDKRVEPERQRTTRGRDRAAQHALTAQSDLPVVVPSSISEQEQIDTIREVLDEGLDFVNGLGAETPSHLPASA